MKGKSNHTKEFREEVAKEAIESGNATATAKKYEVSPRNVYGWMKVYRDKNINQSKKTNRNYEKIIEEKDLEIMILKELLKKTTAALVPESK